MNRYLSCLTLSAALLLPGLATARPVTIHTTLKEYGGGGAYLALYLTDPSGAFVRTLWVAGKSSKYHKHLKDWNKASGGKSPAINGITGASVGAGRTLTVTVELADALIDAGYTIHVDAAAEDLRDSPRDISVPLTTTGTRQASGRSYVDNLRYEL
jgi:hypothetical protein